MEHPSPFKSLVYTQPSLGHRCLTVLKEFVEENDEIIIVAKMRQVLSLSLVFIREFRELEEDGTY